MSSKYRVTKGFKFHAQPQTGAYSCYYNSHLSCTLTAVSGSWIKDVSIYLLILLYTVTDNFFLTLSPFFLNSKVKGEGPRQIFLEDQI